MKNQIKQEFWPLIILALTTVFAIISHRYLPDTVITHWNFQGVADGWSSKNFHSWFFILLMLGLYGLFLILPNFDPKKTNYQSFEKSYQLIKILLLGFFAIVYFVATLANLNLIGNINYIISPIIGLLLIMLGQLLKNITPNWFVGIKTPWTLSNDKVWQKTHHFGAKLFLVWGLSFFILPFLKPSWALTIFLLGVASIVIGTGAYSYFSYKQEIKKNNLKRF